MNQYLKKCTTLTLLSYIHNKLRIPWRKFYAFQEIARSFLALVIKSLFNGILRTQANQLFLFYKKIANYHPRFARETYIACAADVSSSVVFRKSLDINIEMQLPKKKSDTLFILGSGPSITERSNQDWEHIKQHDSWGFNAWFIHDFIPDHYFIHGWGAKYDPILVEILRDKFQSYCQVPFFFVTGISKHSIYQSILGSFLIDNRPNINVFDISIISFNSYFPISTSELLQLLVDSGYYGVDDSISPIPKLGASVTMLISLAVRLRYKNIVLCGIDMNSVDHFYSSPEYMQRYPKLDVVCEDLKRYSVHPHVIPELPYNNVERIVGMKHFFEEAFNCSIFTASKNSLLFPRVPLYTFPSN